MKIEKRKKRRLRIAVFLTALSVFLQCMSVSATEEGEDVQGQEEQLPSGPDWAIDENAAPDVVAESAILVDVDTGVTLYEKNIHEKLYPASITKLLTCLVAFEHSELTDMVTFSHEAVYGIERGSSNIAIDEGRQLTMQDCYYAALLVSANEVSSAMAEHVGGSIEGFADMMNAKVRELGGTDSHFVNANGLHNEEHYTSARDMSLIGRAFFQNETLSEISGTAYYCIEPTPVQEKKIELRNHHRMLPDCQLSRKKPYEYTVGGKTGYTNDSGNTLVTCAEKDGHRLVCVVLKDTNPKHYLDSIALFDYGFACYENPSVKALIDAKAEELKPAEEETEDINEPARELTPEEREERENRVDSLADKNQAGMDEADGQEEGKTSERKRSGGISILTIIVSIVVLAAVMICGLILYRNFRREQERRRRQAEIMARHRDRKRQGG